MAIVEKCGKVKDENSGGYRVYSQIFTDFDNSYDWVKVVKSEDTYTHNCYITDTLYLQLKGDNIGRTGATFKISACGTFGEKSLFSVSVNNAYITWTFTKTAKGFACQLSASTSEYVDYKRYNLYVGEVTKLDGSTVWGCIYTADDGTLTIATDSGISEESAQKSVISADRKAVLIPVVNTTTGDIFSDIFIMRYSPLQYNIMDVDGQGVFLCGKALTLKD